MPSNKTPHLISDGDRFFRLTVVKFSHHDKRWRRHYLVRCDCGKEKTVQGTLLRSGNTKSCGCLSKETKAATRIPDNHSEVTAIILGYQRHAKDRKIDWCMTRRQVDQIVRKPCYYCGEKAGNLKKTKNCLQGFAHNGLDRMDASGCYEIGNVVPCCGICNMSKGIRSEQEFIMWAKQIAKRWG